MGEFLFGLSFYLADSKVQLPSMASLVRDRFHQKSSPGSDHHRFSGCLLSACSKAQVETMKEGRWGIARAMGHSQGGGVMRRTKGGAGWHREDLVESGV